MNAEPIDARDWMYHMVIVRPEPAGQFSAQPLGVPEIRVVAASVAQAVAQVQQALKDWGWFSLLGARGITASSARSGPRRGWPCEE
jgi:hypothetical protein